MRVYFETAIGLTPLLSKLAVGDRPVSGRALSCTLVESSVLGVASRPLLYLDVEPVAAAVVEPVAASVVCNVPTSALRYVPNNVYEADVKSSSRPFSIAEVSRAPRIEVPKSYRVAAESLLGIWEDALSSVSRCRPSCCKSLVWLLGTFIPRALCLATG